MEASIEEAEDTARLSEHIQPRRRLCIYGIRVLMTMIAALSDKDGPAESAMTTEASAEYEEYATRPRNWRQRRRRRGIDDRPKEYTMATEALEEEDEHED